MINLLIIITILPMCGWISMSTCATNSPHKLNSTILSSDEIQDAAKVEFWLNNNINMLRNLLNGVKNIPLLSRPPRHNSTPVVFNTTVRQLKTTLPETNTIAVNDIALHSFPDANIKVHSKFRYGINYSNNENNLKNSQKQTTPLFSDIKLVNSSSSSSAAGVTATVFGPTNPKFAASSYFERAEMQESLMRSKSEKLLLHRNKRYLVFPEGSSFQLVFDLIIPIVDYTNFAIMGITCAVAWELPSKPPSEIIENFRTKLNDGTFGLNRRNDTALQSLMYINSQRTEQQATEQEKRWKEGVPKIRNHNFPQLSAATATTSGYKHFLTYIPETPFLQPSNSFNYNDYVQREQNQQPLSYPYGQQAQQQHDDNAYEAFDTNQRKTLYVNTNGINPMYRNEFRPYVNKYKHLDPPASKSTFQNWQQKVQQQPQQTNVFFGGEGSYLNKNRIATQLQKNQQKWWKYQEKPQVYVQNLMSSERTGRNRKILNKPPRHRIYPIFGKRRRRHTSADSLTYIDNDDLAKELHDIHTREHIRTRLKLYSKIEKLYKTRGQNGTACILRALCDTEKAHTNRYNEAPQSFIMELLRSIFALPKGVLTNSKESLVQVDDHYVNAVLQAHDVTQACSQQYDGCSYSITYHM